MDPLRVRNGSNPKVSASAHQHAWRPSSQTQQDLLDEPFTLVEVHPCSSAGKTRNDEFVLVATWSTPALNTDWVLRNQQYLWFQGDLPTYLSDLRAAFTSYASVHQQVRIDYHRSRYLNYPDASDAVSRILQVRNTNPALAGLKPRDVLALHTQAAFGWPFEILLSSVPAELTLLSGDGPISWEQRRDGLHIRKILAVVKAMEPNIGVGTIDAVVRIFAVKEGITLVLEATRYLK